MTNMQNLVVSEKLIERLLEGAANNLSEAKARFDRVEAMGENAKDFMLVLTKEELTRAEGFYAGMSFLAEKITRCSNPLPEVVEQM